MGPVSDVRGEEIDLSKHTRAEWDDLDGSMLAPTAAIRLYLDTDDVLTNHAIDMMELAIERAHGIEEPWFVASHRTGKEELSTLAVDYFYLMKS